MKKKCYPLTKRYPASVLPNNYSETEDVAIYKQDSINEALFFRTVWGAKYKDAYTEQVPAKVASLDTLYGGLHVIRETGDEEYNASTVRG